MFCLPVDLSAIRVVHNIVVQGPLPRVVGDVLAESFEDGSVEVFYFYIFLKVIGAREQVLESEKATDVV